MVETPKRVWTMMHSKDLWKTCIQAIKDAVSEIDDPKLDWFQPINHISQVRPIQLRFQGGGCILRSFHFDKRNRF